MDCSGDEKSLLCQQVRGKEGSGWSWKRYCAQRWEGVAEGLWQNEGGGTKEAAGKAGGGPVGLAEGPLGSSP